MAGQENGRRQADLERAEHSEAHARDHAAHEREHGIVLESHRRAHDVAAAAHEREHRELAREVRETAQLHLDNHALQHQEANRALDKATQALDRRLDSMNEFRAQLNTQATTFVTRTEHAARLEATDKALVELQQWRAAEGGKDRGGAPFVSIIISVVTAVLSALAVGAVVIATR